MVFVGNERVTTNRDECSGVGPSGSKQDATER